MTGNATKQHSRIFGLDLIRAIAIIIVVISHTSGILKLDSYTPPPIQQVAYVAEASQTTVTPQPTTTATINEAAATAIPAEQHTTRRGRVWVLGVLGVELFFVLSGFLIGNILIRQFLTSEKFGLKEIGQFLARRWMRTLPNYWFVLTAIIFLYHFTGKSVVSGESLPFYFFLQNVFTPHPHFFNEAWSLAVEEWFYLTTPFAIFLASRFFPRTDKSKLLLNTFIAYMLVFIGIRIANSFHPLYGDDLDAGIRKVVIFRLDAIMYGVLIAMLMRNNNSFVARNKKLLLWFSIISSLTVTLLMYYFEPGQAHTTHFLYTPFNCVLLYTLIPFCFCLSLPYASGYTTGSQKPNLFERGISYTSKISYSIYLTHFNIFILLGFGKYHFDNYAYAIGFYALYILCVVAVSQLLYLFIEQPILRLRDRTVRERQA